MHDMKLEDISDRANRERIKQKKSRARKLAPPPPKPKKELTPESWQVFDLIYTRYMDLFFWYFIVLTLGFVFGGLYLLSNLDWACYPALGFFSLFTLRLITHQVAKRIDYMKFKHWRERLGFPVHGWEHIVDNKDFFKSEHWDLDVGLTISLKAPVPREALKLIDDSLFIVITEANKVFYELNFSQSGFSGDIRKKWAKAGPMGVKGSASGYIVGLLYVLITEYLRSIHQKWGVIQEVTLHFSGQVRQMRRVEVSMD